MSKKERNRRCDCGSGKKYKNCCINNNTESHTQLSKKSYEKDYLPALEKWNFEPQTVIEFPFTLPFHIPMYLPNTFSYVKGDISISIRFEIIEESLDDKYLFNFNKTLVKSYFSKVSIVIGLLKKVDQIENYEEVMTKYFDLGLIELNKFLICYMNKLKDDSVHYITKEMLAPVILVRFIDTNDWEEDNNLLLILHPYHSCKKEQLSIDELDDIITKFTIISEDVNPFLINERYVLFARRYRKLGFYNEAAIYIQISIETLIRTIYKEILKIKEDDDEELKRILEDTSFMSIVKKELPHLLGGNWNINDISNPAGQWYQYVYKLRNRVIHTGYMPNFDELDKALYYGTEFRVFIVELLNKKKKVYPKLSEMLTLPSQNK